MRHQHSTAHLVLSTVLLLSLTCLSCGTVPITGRKRLTLIPAQTVQAMCLTSYQEFLSQNKVSTNAKQTQMVQRVGRRIQKGVEQYFASVGRSNDLAGYAWEFDLVESKEVNAWCMPGGKVVVYTGILPVAGDEQGLAVVLGHEISHAVANHGTERMSQALLVQLGGSALEEAMANRPAETAKWFKLAYGMGSQVGVLLPFSRMQESEADRLGLIFMAMAGYDPHTAVGFWQRMEKAETGGKPPAFLSTHPSDAKRIAAIQSEMPEAMQHYRPQ